MLEVRAGVAGDLGAIDDIYTHYIRTTAITFDVEPMSTGQRMEWFTHYAATGRHRLLVAVDGGEVLGYATSSRHRPKAAYETTVETTVYLSPLHTGRGVGSALYGALLAGLEDEDVHRACAGITMPNEASLRLHLRLGFRQVGCFTEQGRKFGRYWDVAWFERPVGGSREGGGPVG